MTNEENKHDPECKACAWLRKKGVWQPPEVVLTMGFPAECLCMAFQVDKAGLDDIARKCGLLVLAEKPKAVAP